jgi:2,3-diketo-5-methylthio-1-phosphopentane phosphatase
MKTIHFFLDFDGTIAQADVVDLVLDRFAGGAWKDAEKEWLAGRIGSRECLSRQIKLIQATPEELRQEISKVKLDPHFVPFIKKAEELGVLVTIVSDGFDVFIEQVLKNNLHEKPGFLKALPIYSNKLRKTASGFEAVFRTETPCVHGCANCKALVMKNLTSRDDHVFFVGDGFSDCYAAQQAHLTFAKDKLLDYCRENAIDHIAYKDFKKVENWLVENHSLLKKTRIARS